MHINRYSRNFGLLAATIMTGVICGCSPNQSSQVDGSTATAYSDPSVGASQEPGIGDSGDGPMAEVSADLYQEFEKHKDNPAHVERVIITYEKGDVRPNFAVQGVEIVSEMKNTPVIVCNVTYEGLQSLSTMDGVRRIEADGTMGIPEEK